MKWIISRLVEAKDIETALKEKGKIVDIRQVSKSPEQLTPLLGFEISPINEDDD